MERVSAWTRTIMYSWFRWRRDIGHAAESLSITFFFDSSRDAQLSHAIAACCLLALALRRRLPETCALIVFVLSVVQLVFLGLIEVGHIVASLCALYSAVLYGQ